MKEQTLILKGKTAVFIDWANVYGWKKSLRYPVDPKKLFKHLKLLKEIESISFYFGKDTNVKSRTFLENVKRIGYRVVTKPVKYIYVAEIENKKLYRRKCDFDMEICIDVHAFLNKDYTTYVFFTGDGDFEPLYQLLAKQKKQVIVIYAPGHLGREIYSMKKGIYKKAISTLGIDIFTKK